MRNAKDDYAIVQDLADPAIIADPAPLCRIRSGTLLDIILGNAALDGEATQMSFRKGSGSMIVHRFVET